MLGARVVDVLRPPVVAVGGRPRGCHPADILPIDAMCARPEAGKRSAQCQDPPNHTRQARRARGGRVLSSSRWGHRGCILRSARDHRPDVRAVTFGGALRAAKTHPITPDTLGARVVAVLEPLVTWWPSAVRPVTASVPQAPNTAMAASEMMGFSRSGHPWYPTSRPMHPRATQARRVASARTSGPQRAR